MAFLATTLGAPTLCIRAGVTYEKQYLVPDSGVYNFSSPYLNNWSFPISLSQNNARIRGEYSLEDNFEQGYFNFENWNGRITTSTDGTKSGYQSVIDGAGKPYLANFWGRGESAVSRDALYKYGLDKKNITTACVMSGVNQWPNADYPNLKLYTGTIPSGAVTVYGRVGSVNPSYGAVDKILAFTTVPTPDTDVSATSGAFITGTAIDDASTGGAFGNWSAPSNATTNNGSGAITTVGVMAGGDSHYLLTTNYGLSIPSDAIVDGIEVLIRRRSTMGTTVDAKVRIVKGGVISSTDMSSGTNWDSSYRSDTYGGGSSLWGETWTASDINSSTFGLAISAHNVGADSIAEIDYVSINIYYHTVILGGSSLSGSLNLISDYYGNNRRLKWWTQGFGQDIFIELPNTPVTTDKFVNFLMTYNTTDYVGRFYSSYDDEPLTLQNVVFLGDLTQCFQGEVTFFEDSYDTSFGSINNPKILTDFGISNRAWASEDITLFDCHRLNGARFIDENPLTSFPSASGSDTTGLAFHFPVKSSGTIGSCDSGNYQALQYYVPLSSGINSELQEFDRSQFNGTALSLDLWASNTGTNPSGNLGALINFCTPTGFFSRSYFTPNYIWSGIPVQIPSGISQIRMSGRFFNSEGGPSDLAEVSLNQANHAQLFLGTWYNNIHREYNGDIKLYNAKVSLDAFITTPKASGQIDLYCSGRQYTADTFPLYLQNSIQSDGFDLFIKAQDSASGSFPLFIAGSFASNNFPLYIGGHGTSSGDMTLFIEGGTCKANMPLYIYSAPIPQGSGDLNLYMWATQSSGVRDYMSLFIGENAPSGVITSSMNLYTKGPDSIRLSSSMNLFLNSDYPKESNSLDLFCCNQFTGSSGNLTLFLQAPSGTLGAIPVSGSMNLFLNRETESVAHNIPLFLGAPESSTGNIPLSITGANITTGQIPLYTNGIGVSRQTLKLFTHGF